jgi:soluble P-type ATPase
MRNGTAKFHHTYECPYSQIRFTGFEDRAVETTGQNNKPVVQNLKLFVIDTGDGENDKLVIPVADYGIMSKYGGTIDVSDAEEAFKILTVKMKGENSN